ncbi:MAG: AI-2E family transporter [Actinomycetota bacterium]|nr:AI-2E family transporter [Actinomycetota bacterium]
MSSRAAGRAGLTGRAVYVGVLLLFGLAVASYFVYQVGQVVLALLLTLLFSVILSGPVDYLARRGLTRGWATAVVVGAAVLVLSIAGVLMAPVVEEQGRQFAEDLPALLGEAEALVARGQQAVGLGDADESLGPGSLLQMAQDFVSQDVLAATADVGRSIVAAVSLGIVALISTIFLVARPYPMIDGFVSLFPAGWRAEVRRVLGEVYDAVRRWLLGQLVAMTFIGLLSTLALTLLGVPFAVLLGLFSGLISFVPFVGAVVSVIPPVLLALASDPIVALWVILAYTVIQQLESQIIQPVVMSRAVALHPAVVLFAILALGTLFGVVGFLLAVPLVATLQVLVRELWVRRTDEMGTDPTPPDRVGRSGKPGLLRRVLLRARNFVSRHR